MGEHHTDQEFNQRWATAQEFGWFLDRTLYGDSGIVFVLPPPHFECSRRHWAATFQQFHLDDDTVTVPSWFWNDHVMKFGTWDHAS